jgi:RNA polymerase sigma-70 factor (ECF subfamily)
MSDCQPSDSLPDMTRGREFLRLYQANERRIFGFLLALVPQWSEAEDLLQETTMTMWSKFDTFEPGTDFAAWALCIARYRVMNHRRKKRNQRVQFSDEVLEAIDERVRGTAAELDALRDALGSCLRKLPERDRDLIHLRYEYGATTKSVAQRLGRSVDAVYKALNRIHIQLLYCIRRTLAMEESA